MSTTYLADRVTDLAHLIDTLADKINGKSNPYKDKCEVPIYKGAHNTNVLNSWIMDMGTWFSFIKMEDEDHFPFSLLKIYGITKMAVLEHHFKSWDALVELLGNTFYPPNYNMDIQAQWI